MVFFNPHGLVGMDGIYCEFYYNKVAIVPYQKGRRCMILSEVLGQIEGSSPTHSQKAILWGPESLLVDSIEFFLKTGAAWDVVKILSERGADYLVQQVKTVKPKVVILCQEKDISDAALLMQLAQIQLCTKVVVVSMESNLVQVYSRNNFIMRDVSDLLHVVDTK